MNPIRFFTDEDDWARFGYDTRSVPGETAILDLALDHARARAALETQIAPLRAAYPLRDELPPRTACTLISWP